MKTIDNLKIYKKEGNIKEFNKLISKLLPKLEKYIKHKIKIYETKNKLPVNFYSPTDILADVYLKIYHRISEISDEKKLKIELFKLADNIIESYVKKENTIRKKIDIDEILKEEIDYLKEEITVTADGEVVLVNELTDEDIEYMQKEFKPKIYLFDFNTQIDFAKSLGLTPDDFKDEKLRAIFGSIYGQLPETIRRVLDLNSLGGLTYDEIAEVMDTQPKQVENIIVSIKMLLKNQQ